ncbi:MAG: hypothetical protein HC857_11015 [Synechococcales cyanobacterium RU_4_20]|nr:hypothetical protein [Synechococcales cyanobacterium RU_4_20]NJR71033.1 hypothetical protein [Synechococcales cyanobacterium CRU_2_2]
MGTLLLLVGLGIYGWGAVKFWSGFRRTNFNGNRLMLTGLWPLLVIANRSYRQNFQKALKG